MSTIRLSDDSRLIRLLTSTSGPALLTSFGAMWVATVFDIVTPEDHGNMLQLAMFIFVAVAMLQAIATRDD